MRATEACPLPRPVRVAIESASLGILATLAVREHLRFWSRRRPSLPVLIFGTIALALACLAGVKVSLRLQRWYQQLWH